MGFGSRILFWSRPIGELTPVRSHSIYQAASTSMTMAVGVEVFKVDEIRVIARGVQHTTTERDQSLNGPVRKLIEDEDGKKKALDATASLALTDFGRGALDEILSAQHSVEDWRVGEAYGEAYLVIHKRCAFPWPDKWDERKSGSSLPGADFVGFQETGTKETSYRFAFGEAKTSYDLNCPPSTMFGRTGLKQQLEDLSNSKEVRDDLFRYLMIRAIGSSWQDKWKSAAQRYLADKADVAVFGILVRDVAPNKADLQARSKSLAENHPKTMHIELLGIYLPTDSIKNFAATFSPKPPKKGGAHVDN